MSIEFWTSLIKTPEANEFLNKNCTHVTGEYWIFEGENELLSDELDQFQIIAEGAVPCLGDFTEKELIAGCDEWFGIEIK